MDYETILANSFWVVPLVVAIVQAIKMIGVASKFSPIISIGVGIGIAFLMAGEFTLSQTILHGVIYGLSASGLYSGISTTQKVRDVKSGEIPLDKVDKGLLNEKDLQQIQEKKSQTNSTDINNSNNPNIHL